MRIMALNCGSSSLKFQLLEVSAGREQCLLKGRVKMGAKGGVQVLLPDGVSFSSKAAVTSATEALDLLWQQMDEIRGCEKEHIQAVGHRIVHGGNEFIQPVIIDDLVINSLEANVPLAPLHNKPALELVEKARNDLGPDVPMVGVFDTAFHHTLPEYARRYALPENLVQKYNLWRYGFHGLAHRWMAERYSQVAEQPVTAPKLITIQLGGGCSMAAINNGRSLDTSMGLTPLEGLMMSTRCGDVDPLIPYLLAENEGFNAQEIEDCLYRKSGLLGVTGSSGDMQSLLEAEQRFDLTAKLALDMFCYRVQKYIGAYLAVLGGADAIMFGGGIGENAPAIRSRICRNMGWCGLRLAEQRNKEMAGQEGCISEVGSYLPAYVINVEEEVLIGRDSFQCLAVNREVPAKGYHA